jgi:hypothetical protein
MIRSRKIWTTYCEGCLSDYGQFETKAAAEAHEREFPLCSSCDGEDY